MLPTPSSPTLLLGSALLSLLLASCTQREGSSRSGADSSSVAPPPETLGVSLPPTDPEESIVEECTEPRWRGTDSLLATLVWDRPDHQPDLEGILRRSELLVGVKREIHERSGCGQGRSLALAIPFEDSLAAWIRAWEGALVIPTNSDMKWQDLADTVSTVDSATSAALPRTGPSGFFQGRSVFLQSGGPFLEKRLSEKGEAFLGLDGKPETRHAAATSTASLGLLSILRSFGGVGMGIRRGPPLMDYESGPYGVAGAGSLEMVLTSRVGAWFLTRSGAFPARAVSVRHKLFAPGTCDEHLPQATWATSAEAPSEILAVYLSRDGLPPPSVSATTKGKVTTLDLDGDQVPEYAMVENRFEGINGDQLSSVYWFRNDAGKWVPVDHAAHLDCT